MDAFIDTINQRFTAGYAVLVELHGIDLTVQEFRSQDFPSDLVVKFEVGVEIWKWLAKKLGISLAHSFALISPNGKVLVSSQHGEDIQQSCDRLERVWVQTLAEEKASLKERIYDMNSKNASRETEEEVQQHVAANPRRRSADDWVMNKAVSSKTTTTTAAPAATNHNKAANKRESTNNQAKGVAALSSQQSIPATVVPTTTTSPLHLRDSTTTTKSTKISVKFSNGAPRKVIDVPDASKFTLSDLVAQLSENVEELVLEYPRRKFDPTSAQDGSKTIAELDLGQNPSFMAIVKDRFLRRGTAAPQQHGGAFAFVASILGWIVSLLAAIFNRIKQAFPNAVATGQQQQQPQRALASSAGGAAAAARLRRLEDEQQQPQQQNKKKPNQYWNGDSTVFESPPDDDDENENTKRN